MLDEEWLVYYSPVLNKCRAMSAENYGLWRGTATRGEKKKFPILAQGLTAEVALKMVDLTREETDD